jgi:hypothetical protein
VRSSGVFCWHWQVQTRPEVTNSIAGGAVVDGNLMLEVLRYSNFTGQMGIATVLSFFWSPLAFWDCRPVHGCSDRVPMLAVVQHCRLGMAKPNIAKAETGSFSVSWLESG